MSKKQWKTFNGRDGFTMKINNQLIETHPPLYVVMIGKEKHQMTAYRVAHLMKMHGITMPDAIAKEDDEHRAFVKSWLDNWKAKRASFK